MGENAKIIAIQILTVLFGFAGSAGGAIAMKKHKDNNKKPSDSKAD